MKILIIEDNNTIIDSVAQILAIRWPEASLISTSLGEAGVELARKERPDLVLLDLGLPDIDGFQVLRNIRGFSSVPLVILTARGDEINKIKGLEIGADDYIVKPFSVGEFLARLKAVLRRSQMTEPTAKITEKPFIRGNLRIDFQSREVSIGDKAIQLSPSEYDMLYILATNEGRVLSKQMLLENVWGTEYEGLTEYVEVYVKSLQEMLKREPGHTLTILDQGNTGYKLVSQ
ncbi:MAG: response regulator transcription factor [Dehalococcoidia bacterium]|nr:response regulator transcription factor [Dehalococcoidia bacterium]